MTRAALYARYSSDLQSDTSIEDQFRLCREHAKRSGLEIVAEYADAAKSGASLFGRDGAFDLMAAAQNGAFEVVIVESLDRLSRDQEDLARLYKRLSFKGIKIEQVHGGRADEIQVGVRGLLGALYLKDLADKTRRGLAGKVASGQSAGGKAYGYRPVKGEPGRMEIVEEQAEIVRRIFREYLDGASARQIAADLNRDGIEPPRGAVWNASTIYGQASNLSGILRVPQYHGEIIWNKVRYLKDPETGKRVPKVNPPEEWQHIDVPELRIVDERLWIKVRQKLGGTGKGGKGLVRKHRLLSGLIKCGVCGGGMSVSGTTDGRPRISCSRHREAGACTHGRSYFLDKVECFVIAALQAMALNAGIMKDAVDHIVKKRRAEISQQAKIRAKAEGELDRVKARYDRAIKRSVQADTQEESDRWAAELPAVRIEIAKAEAALAMIDKPSAVDLHQEWVDWYTRTVDNLAILTVGGAQESAAFHNLARNVIHAIVIHETEPSAPMWMEGQGPLFGITGEALAEVAVAGAGFEPAAFRL